MRVSRARISGSMLSRLGARWVTMMKAMPGLEGMARNRLSSASTPPAEAPTPTMGKRASMAAPRQSGGKPCQLARWRSRPGNLRQIKPNSKGLGRSGAIAQGARGQRPRPRQQPERALDGLVRGIDLVAQLGNLETRVIDQASCLDHQVAMF